MAKYIAEYRRKFETIGGIKDIIAKFTIQNKHVKNAIKTDTYRVSSK